MAVIWSGAAPVESAACSWEIVASPQARFADTHAALRDRVDDLLFGCQDYAVIATKPA